MNYTDLVICVQHHSKDNHIQQLHQGWYMWMYRRQCSLMFAWCWMTLINCKAKTLKLQLQLRYFLPSAKRRFSAYILTGVTIKAVAIWPTTALTLSCITEARSLSGWTLPEPLRPLSPRCTLSHFRATDACRCHSPAAAGALGGFLPIYHVRRDACLSRT